MRVRGHVRPATSAESGVDWTTLAGGAFEQFYEAHSGAVVRLSAALVGR
jgi:hypothetical protein